MTFHLVLLIAFIVIMVVWLAVGYRKGEGVLAWLAVLILAFLLHVIPLPGA